MHEWKPHHWNLQEPRTRYLNISGQIYRLWIKPILFQIPCIAYNTHLVNLGRKELTGMSSWYRFSFWSTAFRPFFHCSKSAKANVSISAYLQLTWVVQTNLSLYALLARFTRQTTYTLHFDRKHVLFWVFQGSVQEYVMNGRLKLLSKSMHGQIYICCLSDDSRQSLNKGATCKTPSWTTLIKPVFLYTLVAPLNKTCRF